MKDKVALFIRMFTLGALNHLAGNPNSLRPPSFEEAKLHWEYFPGGTSGKEHTCQCRRHKRYGFSLWVGKIPWRRAWQPTLVCLPGEAYEQRSLGGYRWSIMLQRVGHD